MSKYGNHKTVLDGVTFDSRAEAAHYEFLRARLLNGEITELRIHPRYTLQDGFKNADGKWERAILYEADFEYFERGHCVVVDVKGVETAVFKLKRKLFLKRYPQFKFRIEKVKAR